MEGILTAMYEVISGPKGEPRDWARFRGLFAEGARLIPVRVGQDGRASARVLDVEEFISLVGPATKEEGFFESEISRKVQQYGHITHVFSTYESRKARGEKPFVRGINSIQLLNDGKRWWIVTIYWDSERTGQPIPPEYLPEEK